ncbi:MULTISPECIES: EAL domain-containing protein [Pseudoalteromonas]|uniref:Diguanylate phosphodiesterase n=1 Tax=Pseudoalteromonas amylolytica TaxID=1859457 RepID=A0A1S1MQY3_9GAMM|nr:MULTISPECIES: EAL domain-containing protein [Pseudoalteromonas]OHU86736.1 diguanylate phosphodiesterase [Pseudoalteromonas sp. JW3]OHU88739.1 diguanylate phosphodiesterase [Pseudoalteromonas amylolytica]
MLSNNKLESKTEQLSIINQFSSSLLQITQLDELFDYVTSQVVSRLGFVDCVIYLADEQSEFLEEVASMGVAHQSNDYKVAQTKIPIEQGITGHVARTRQAFVSGDVSVEPMYIADSRPALSEICVPLVYENTLLGVIDCEHPQRDYFTEGHLQILSTVAHLLSAKINQVKTLNNLTKTIEQLNQAQQLEQCLLKIANITYRSLDLEAFYDELYQIINSQLPAENFFIGLYDRYSDILEIDYLIEGKVKCNAHQRVTKAQIKHTASYFTLTSGKPLLCNTREFERHIELGNFQMVGQSPKSWLGVPFAVNDQFQGVIVIQSYTQDRAFNHHHLSILTYISRQVSMAIDRQLSRQALEHRALHDELTGLANRYLLLERVKHAILSLDREDEDSSHCLLYLDFDRFKSINDALGHDVGDRFLVAIVNMIKGCIRRTDTFARLGGDEFAIFIENVKDKEQVSLALERINEAIAKPLYIDGHVLQASTSIGVAFTDDATDNAITLLQQADAAMYEAKSRGRGQVCYFNNAMRKKLKRQADIENDLQHGIQNNEFELYFQPIFALNDPHVVSFEALVRWHHPKNGLVPPNDFIVIAEQTGQIIELDLHLLKLAAQQLQSWRQEGSPMIRITVNVSSRHFASLDFVTYMQQLYIDYQLPNGALCLEITESGLIENLKLATKIIQGLEPLGVKLYLDDFGTGYSALGYLHQLPIHVLKLDKSFVDQLTHKENPLVDAILSLARSLDLKVVAEGIENPKQWALLKRKGCQFGQGFMVSKPLPAKQAMQFLIDNTQMTLSI